MRRPFIAGNWKMNLDRAGRGGLGRGGRQGRPRAGTSVDLAVCPPFCYLDAVGRAVAGSKVALGAQNMYYQPEGAFTGEIAASMLRDLGCRYVILGHSERRHILHETDEEINKKVHAALAAGLVPIVCVGELLAEREAGQTARGDPPAVRRLAGRACPRSRCGRSSSPTSRSGPSAPAKWPRPQQAEEAHLDLRKIIQERYNEAVAQAVRIQYGGSVKPDNAAELLRQPDIDGALVGGASLKADQFMGIVAGVEIEFAAEELYRTMQRLC